MQRASDFKRQITKNGKQDNRPENRPSDDRMDADRRRAAFYNAKKRPDANSGQDGQGRDRKQIGTQGSNYVAVEQRMNGAQTTAAGAVESGGQIHRAAEPSKLLERIHIVQKETGGNGKSNNSERRDPFPLRGMRLSVRYDRPHLSDHGIPHSSRNSKKPTPPATIRLMMSSGQIKPRKPLIQHQRRALSDA